MIANELSTRSVDAIKSRLYSLKNGLCEKPDAFDDEILKMNKRVRRPDSWTEIEKE